MKNTGNVIATLLGGMLVGSALAMLFTPKSGPELRGQIKDFIDDQVDKAKEKAAQVKEAIKEAECACE